MSRAKAAMLFNVRYADKVSFRLGYANGRFMRFTNLGDVTFKVEHRGIH